jgi:hypothetical protein
MMNFTRKGESYFPRETRKEVRGVEGEKWEVKKGPFGGLKLGFFS